MYKIKLSSKEAEELETINFSDLELKERFDIEVWIKNNPNILKEDLKIISEQIILPSGRQPDLIALDKEGKLVIIELKRDDSGRDVYWQAITYAAQFSEYSYTKIIEMYKDYIEKNEENKKNLDSQELIEDFIEVDIEKLNEKQRIILVSKEFHEDVLKAALWLLENYGLDLKIVKLAPYKYLDDILFLDSEVIIPTPGIEDYFGNKANKIKDANKGYKTSWWSLKKGEYEPDELKKKLKDSFTNKISNQTPRLITFFEILLSEDRIFTQKEIKEKFYHEYDIGNNVGQAGRFLSNISQLITKRDNDHLRQVLEFDMPEESEGKPKDNYKVVTEYRKLVQKALDEMDEENP